MCDDLFSCEAQKNGDETNVRKRLLMYLEMVVLTAAASRMAPQALGKGGSSTREYTVM